MDTETKREIEQLKKQLKDQLRMIKNHEMRIRHIQNQQLTKIGRK